VVTAAHPAELWHQVSTRRLGTSRRDIIPGRLADITGRPAGQLGLAIPELRYPEPDWTAWRHQPQPDCPRCDARHDGGPITRLLPRPARPPSASKASSGKNAAPSSSPSTAAAATTGPDSTRQPATLPHHRKRRKELNNTRPDRPSQSLEPSKHGTTNEDFN